MISQEIMLQTNAVNPPNTVPSISFFLMASVRLGVVLHRACNVALRVLEEQQLANTGQSANRHNDLAAILLNGRAGSVDVIHRNRAFKTSHRNPRHDLAALLQRSAQRHGRFRRFLVDHIEAWWTVGLKLPAKDSLVEAQSTVNVIGID